MAQYVGSASQISATTLEAEGYPSFVVADYQAQHPLSANTELAHLESAAQYAYDDVCAQTSSVAFEDDAEPRLFFRAVCATLNAALIKSRISLDQSEEATKRNADLSSRAASEEAAARGYINRLLGDSGGMHIELV